MDNLILLAQSMQQAAAMLADEDAEDPGKGASTFMNVVALGSVGAGKSAVLNSLIGHPVLPTGENGATRAPIVIEMERSESVGRGLYLLLDGKTAQVSASELRHSLQGRLSKLGLNSRSSSQGINLHLRSSSAPPLKLIDLPGLDPRATSDDPLLQDFASHNDSVLLVVVPASSARDITGSRALKVAQDLDPDGSRTVGIISKVDQAESDQKSLAAVQALLLGQGPSVTAEVPWVALIGQSVSIAAAHSGSMGADDSLETAWKAEKEKLKTILSGAPSSALGRVSLVEKLSEVIRKRLKQRLPSLLSGLEGRSQAVEDELVRLGAQMVQTSEGTRAIALEMCREFEDRFLQHIQTGEGAGWKVVQSFEGGLPNRIKALPLNEIFELSSIKKLVLEADGYQPYLLSPEKGLRALVRKALELAKEPGKHCVDEVHRILVDIVAAAASSTPGLSRYPPLKREIVAIASSALDGYRMEAKNMVVALVDMERSFIPPQHFIRLVQRRLDRVRREEEVKTRASRKAQDAEQALLNKATAPQANSTGSLKSLKAEKDIPSALQTITGPEGQIIVAGYLSKLSAKPAGGWSKRWFVLNQATGKFSYTKKPEESRFRATISLEECIIEDMEKEVTEEVEEKKKSSKKSAANGPDSRASTPSLSFKLSSKVPYKTLFKAHHSITLKAETPAEKADWLSRLRNSGKEPVKGPVLRGSSSTGSLAESGGRERSTSVSDGPSESVLRRPADPEEDLKLMSQEVRDYVEAVLNSLAANIPKAVVLCQVERAKEAMLNQLYSSISLQSTAKIQELLVEDQEVKRRRERATRQHSLLNRLTRQLSLHDARASTNSGFGNDSVSGSPGGGASEDWRVAFEEAASVSSNDHVEVPREVPRSYSRQGNGPQRYEHEENGDSYGRRSTPTRLPPPPPPGGAPVYRY